MTKKCKCGAENPENAHFCKICGDELNSTGNASFLNNSRNMTFLGVGAAVILLVIVFSVLAFASMNATINVNSAFYTSNVIDKQPVNGKFLIMNVTVKNNGNDPLTVSTDQFAPYINGKPVDKYSIFSGEGTDLNKTVKIPGGGSQDVIVVFDINNQTPDNLILQGPLSWAPTHKTDTSLADIASGAYFNGMTYKAELSLDGKTSQYMGINASIKSNGTSSGTYQKMTDPNKVQYISVNDMTTKTILSNGQETNDPGNDKKTDIIDLTTFKNETGDLDSDFLPKNLTKPGDSITVKNQTLTLKGSQKIDILGKKIDCWVTETTENEAGMQLKATVYYDKTTRFMLKAVFNNQTVDMPGLPMTMDINGQGIIKTTNMPLIGSA